MRGLKRALAMMAGVGVLAILSGAALLCQGYAGQAWGQKTDQIVWADFDKGTAFAMKQNLPVMLHFTTTWCGWCKKLEQEVYTSPEVIRLSKKFVCIKVDGDKMKELVQKYKVTGYPNIVFTNSKGEEAHRIPGFMPAEGFIAQMKAALEKLGTPDKPATGEKK